MGIAQENTRVPGAVLTPETASVSGAGRFAPSPSGDFHLGNLRTYTLAWIFARATGRRMLYRVEDIDRERSHDSAALDQMEDLASFGMDWDEDPVKQSDRFPLYDDVLAWLAKRGWVYECYCSRKDIREASRAPHATPGMYPGTCRNLTDEQRQEQRNKLAAQGRPPAIRFNAHAAYDAIVADGHATTNNRSTDNHTTPPRLWTIHEDFTTPPEHSEPHYDPASKDRPASTLSSVSTGYSGPVDDIVLRRGDGNWAYNLAVVVDDLTMGIDQITRGDDLLASAPGQNFLATVLEPWATDASHKTAIAPTRWRYNHVPLVVTREQMKGHETTDHQLKRLAKRDGAVTVRELGHDTAWAWVAQSLGHPECASAPELLDAIDIDAMSHDPVVGHLSHKAHRRPSFRQRSSRYKTELAATGEQQQENDTGSNRPDIITVVHVHDLPAALSDRPMSGVKMRAGTPATRGLCPVHEYGYV